jgi:hypothetical protein
VIATPTALRHVDPPAIRRREAAARDERRTHQCRRSRQITLLNPINCSGRGTEIPGFVAMRGKPRHLKRSVAKNLLLPHSMSSLRLVHPKRDASCETLTEVAEEPGQVGEKSLSSSRLQSMVEKIYTLDDDTKTLEVFEQLVDDLLAETRRDQ